MDGVFTKLDGGEILGLCGIIVGLVAIIGGMGVAVTKVVAAHYRKTQLDEMEATLKMEMIQRGMSAAEITQVLEAKMGSSRPTSLNELLGVLPTIRVPNVFGKQCEKG
jgi:hypothetical protein